MKGSKLRFSLALYFPLLENIIRFFVFLYVFRVYLRRKDPVPMKVETAFKVVFEACLKGILMTVQVIFKYSTVFFLCVCVKFRLLASFYFCFKFRKAVCHNYFSYLIPNFFSSHFNLVSTVKLCFSNLDFVF